MSVELQADEVGTREVCSYLRISEKVLRRLRSEGRIEPIETNPLLIREFRLKYRREDVERIKREADELRRRQRKAS